MNIEVFHALMHHLQGQYPDWTAYQRFDEAHKVINQPGFRGVYRREDGKWLPA